MRSRVQGSRVQRFFFVELRTFEPVNGYDINRFIAETAYAILLSKCLYFVLQSWVELLGALHCI